MAPRTAASMVLGWRQRGNTLTFQSGLDRAILWCAIRLRSTLLFCPGLA